MTTLEFQCGCKHDLEVLDAKDVEWWKANGMDTQGFVICPTHKLRRKGWRSIPEITGRNVAGLDYSYAQYSPFQVEQHLVWGKPFPESKLEIVSDNVPDRRDNRDPQTMGAEILDKANGKHKGKGRPATHIAAQGEREQ